jgi:peptide deformylase
MILPIVAYGAPVLRKLARDIGADYPQLKVFIADMWETMYASSGVGLAAPQVNRDVRIFVMDSAQMFQDMEDEEMQTYADRPGFKGVFINAKVESITGQEWAYNEGCLSIPKIREDILRGQHVTISYLDESFQPKRSTFTGITARIILHEYDHIEGKLFIDYLKPLKKKMLQGKLNDISKGKVKVDYKMNFAK